MACILALDLGGTTGFALECLDTGKIKLGTANLVRQINRSKRNPLPFYRLKRRLNRIAKAVQIERVIFEETFGRGAAKFRLDGLQAIVVVWCLENGYAWSRVSPSKWKREMTGNGLTPKEEYHRMAIERWPQFQFRKDDMAAAMWLLEYDRKFRKCNIVVSSR